MSFFFIFLISGVVILLYLTGILPSKSLIGTIVLISMTYSIYSMITHQICTDDAQYSANFSGNAVLSMMLDCTQEIKGALLPVNKTVEHAYDKSVEADSEQNYQERLDVLKKQQSWGDTFGR